MTNEELIALLRAKKQKGNRFDSLEYEAADRIEALSISNATLIAELTACEKYRDAKLAKAVEALRFYAWENEMRLPSDGPWGAGSTDFGKVASTTLAELKGDSHE